MECWTSVRILACARAGSHICIGATGKRAYYRISNKTRGFSPTNHDDNASGWCNCTGDRKCFSNQSRCARIEVARCLDLYTMCAVACQKVRAFRQFPVFRRTFVRHIHFVCVCGFRFRSSYNCGVKCKIPISVPIIYRIILVLIIAKDFFNVCLILYVFNLYGTMNLIMKIFNIKNKWM